VASGGDAGHRAAGKVWRSPGQTPQLPSRQTEAESPVPGTVSVQEGDCAWQKKAQSPTPCTRAGWLLKVRQGLPPTRTCCPLTIAFVRCGVSAAHAKSPRYILSATEKQQATSNVVAVHARVSMQPLCRSKASTISHTPETGAALTLEGRPPRTHGGQARPVPCTDFSSSQTPVLAQVGQADSPRGGRLKCLQFVAVSCVRKPSTPKSSITLN
jgi:hypothetical protein